MSPEDKARLEEAYRSGIPLEGLVKKEIKGGFEVTVAGNVRTFCPFSQMAIKRISDPEEYIDQHMLFRITEYKESGRNIILSRRVILEEEREEKREALKEQLEESPTFQYLVGRISERRGEMGRAARAYLGFGVLSETHISSGEMTEASVTSREEPGLVVDDQTDF